jgi:hypothetical protein
VETSPVSTTTAMVPRDDPIHSDFTKEMISNTSDQGAIPAANNLIWCIGGLGPNTNYPPHAQLSTEYYNPMTHQWYGGPWMDNFRTQQCCAVIGSTIYLFGGVDEHSISGGDGISLDTATVPLLTDSKHPIYSRDIGWKSIADMNVSRTRASAVVIHDDCVLVMGGYDSNQSNDSHSSIERYTPSTDTWQLLSWSLPKPMSSFAVDYNPSTKMLTIIPSHDYTSNSRSGMDIYIRAINDDDLMVDNNDSKDGSRSVSSSSADRWLIVSTEAEVDDTMVDTSAIDSADDKELLPSSYGQ